MLAQLAACDGARRSQADAGGAEIILQASDVHVLGTSDAIATVRDLEVLAGGNVWVLNSVEPFFVGFDPDGNVLQMHGRRGGGPVEFEAPSGFVVGGVDGEAWVFDYQRHAMIEVSRPDGARKEISLPEEAIPPGTVMGGMNLLSNLVRTAQMGDELMLPRTASRGSDVYNYWLSTWSADLIAFDPKADSVRQVIALGEVIGDPTPHFELEDGFPPFPLWFRLWAVCSDSEIRVYDRLRNQVRGFTGDGIELESVSLPPALYDEVTPRQFARVTFDLAVVERMGEVGSGNYSMTAADSAQILNASIQRLSATPQQLANVLPRYVDFRCAADGTQWIQPVDLDMGGLKGGPLWLRITPGGEIDEVRLPDRFDPYRFTHERIWGVQRDEYDVASVAWIAAPPAR
jgi:hypothetical protein